jgi:glycosyltransferase involved in cell wall biosynthesis
MLIGLDAIPLEPPRTGIGHYTYELSCALALSSPADLFELVSPYRPSFPDAAGASPSSLEFPSNVRVAFVGSRLLRRRWWALGAPVYLRRAGLELFHGTNYNVPLWARCPLVLSVHDLSLLIHPETHEAGAVRRARRVLPLMLRAATMILTDTESVRREVCERLGVRPERVAAVHIAPRSVFRPVPAQEAAQTVGRLGIEGEFLLYVGTIEPRKNLKTLVRSLDLLVRSTDLRPRLVVAGKQGWLNEELYAEIGRLGLSERIHFTGYVSDEDLRALYSACTVCIYPSLYEGFGLPPLEAMRCGAPVVASRIPSILETAGEQGARLVPPTDTEALAAALAELLRDSNLRRRLAHAGLARAQEFSWEKTARATLEVYGEAAKRKAKVKR